MHSHQSQLQEPSNGVVANGLNNSSSLTDSTEMDDDDDVDEGQDDTHVIVPSLPTMEALRE